MSTVVNPFSAFFHGLRDSLCFHRSPAAKTNTGNCLLLNGGLFLGSLIFYKLGIEPLNQSILHFTWGDDGKAELPESQRWFAERMLELVFQGCWVVPIFILSKILNSVYCESVANEAYALLRGAATAGYEPIRRTDIYTWLGLTVADLIFSTIMQLLMLVQASLLAYVPTFGPALSFIYTSWITSLYSFEYSWINAGWSLRHRMNHFQQHWAYYLGFGLPLTALTWQMSFLISAATFAILFPFLVIVATVARPVTYSDQSIIAVFLPPSLSVTWPAMPLTQRIFGFMPQLKLWNKDVSEADKTR